MPDTTALPVQLDDATARTIAADLMLNAARDLTDAAIRAKLDDEYGVGALTEEVADLLMDRVADLVAKASLTVDLAPEPRLPASEADTSRTAGEGLTEAEVREQTALLMEEMAAHYPVSVFPPDSEVRDGIAGTAMRHAYVLAARIAREGRLS
jgi:hypothetical protein